MEAVDLGFALAQAEAPAIARLWLRLLLPLVLLLCLAEHLLLAAGRLPWATALVWWCKPLFDAAVLLLLSRRVFGESPSPREVGALLRAHAGTLFAALSWRRFSPARSFFLPAHLLEGLTRANRRERLRLLGADTSGAAWVLTHHGVWLEMALLAGLLAMAWLLTPAIWSDQLRALAMDDEPGHLALLAWQLAYVPVVALVSPFYAAAGFTLYLNRRTGLEAWDVEVALRRLQERLRRQAPAGTEADR